MNTKCNFLLVLVCLIFIIPFHARGDQMKPVQNEIEQEILKLHNPFSVQYLKKNLRKSHPRLVLNSKIERKLKKKLKNDPVVQNMYKAIELNARSILQEPFLERIKTGRRLLSVSREMLYRINMLGLVYRMGKDLKILNRIDGELLAVCNFSDWNPSHYLDVAEMSMAVALAIDWTEGDLTQSTLELAKTALIEKGIKPSYNSTGNTGWITSTNNWNQVCHGGMISASIAIAEKDPELAAKTIKRALDGMPHALVEYGPDGVYPEGSTYWGYGTSFSVITAAMFESSFGTDFGLADFPGLKESATFRVLMNTPSGGYYNFADCGDRRGENGDVTLAWFASKTGNETFFERERFLRSPVEIGQLSRLDGAGLVWLSQFKKRNIGILPTAWKGDGANPLVVFRGATNDPHQYYFGGKGGRGIVNHGNMDGGSFIFELNGVRWVVDPGNQSYHALEKTGFNLWERCQDCERWTLLTKNNFGHSTISVNNEMHVVDGMSTIIEFKEGNIPEAILDMSPAFEGQLKSAKRKFIKESKRSLVIEDELVILDKTKLVTWQLMTTAEVEIVEGGAILRQDGKLLNLENLSHPELSLSVISLSPPPLKLDRQIAGLKRLEIRIPAWTLKDSNCNIKVRLSSD